MLTLSVPKKLLRSGTEWSYANLTMGETKNMKRFAILSALALCFAVIAPAASAQASDDKNHGNFGVYFDYTRLANANFNMFGVGARLGINVHPHVVL
ncbi:MAG TPA: hypothetical protein VE133_17760, partial [Candidatus Sulfotelmatobacter sp.]|nr:hypothetical protein [Candidatus Sulfotelmatobacter sp.]